MEAKKQRAKVKQVKVCVWCDATSVLAPYVGFFLAPIKEGIPLNNV